MTTDNPYVTGFLEEIVGVNFGSNWFGVNASFEVSNPDHPHLGPGTCTMDFPDQIKGTPGLTPMTNIVVSGLTYPGYVHANNGPATFVITKDMLKESLTTPTGLKLNGFAVSKIGSFQGVLLLFNSSKFPETFRVRVSAAGDVVLHNQQATGFWVKKNSMKAGLSFPSSSWFDLPFGAFTDPLPLDAGHVDLVFNKSKLTVSGS